MSTVKDLLDEAMEYEEKILVYHILYAVEKGKVFLTDSRERFKKIRFTQEEQREISKWIQENPLKIEKIRIYCLKMDNTRFAMIFAKNSREAVDYYIKLFKKRPLNCLEHYLDYEVTQGTKPISFRELRKQLNSFPAYVGYMDRSDFYC